MTSRDQLADDIRHQLEGIAVQWRDIQTETDPQKRARKLADVRASMDTVGKMMREYEASDA